MYSEKFLKTLRLLTSPFLAMLEPFFTQRALKRKLDIQRGLQGHSKCTWAFAHSSTRTLKGHLGTQTLTHSSTWAFEELYLADSATEGQGLTQKRSLIHFP